MKASKFPIPINTPATLVNTLTNCINKLCSNGYNHVMKVNSKGLHVRATHKTYTAYDVKLIGTFQFDGQSIPENKIILYVLETFDGVKGILMDTNVSFKTESIAKFIKKVEDTGHSNKPVAA
jgi:hypothetical protein